MTSIRNHVVEFAVDAPSPNRSGLITPKFIVMHYTAGWTARSAVNTLTNPASRVSAHVTIDQNGVVYQHVPFNVKAWHAGPSSHMGYSGLNSHSVGIEIVNPGYLTRVDGNRFRDAYGRVHTAANVGPVVESRHARVGSGTYFWPVYPEAQLEAVEELTQELLQEYNILDIVTHEEIDTRGWKTDPGPAFPMNRFKRHLGHRDLDGDTYQVTASVLNVRGGPGSNYSVEGQVKRGDVVTGTDKNGDWVKIDEDGWVHGGYLRRI
jgi:N-acetylmuramoyl-L-alanine amidase